MSDSRRRILEAVRRALPGERGDPDAERAALLAAPPPRPAWSLARLERFLAQFERALGSFSRVDGPAGIPAAAARYLDQVQAAPELLLAPDPLLTSLIWPSPLRTAVGPEGAAGFASAIVVAACGIAETGSLVLPSGPTRPTTMNFLPDQQLLVLLAADVVDHLEDAWSCLRARGPLPRTVNVVTGPSRTADVEQTIQIGAHGPRRVHLILID